jgi:hypothetical protein
MALASFLPTQLGFSSRGHPDARRALMRERAARMGSPSNSVELLAQNQTVRARGISPGRMHILKLTRVFTG